MVENKSVGIFVLLVILKGPAINVPTGVGGKPLYRSN